ncbi:MAG: glycosyltransferase [Phycisphaerales bacterium]
MHIVHYLSRIRLADGGVVRAVLDICSLMAQSGHDITILTGDGSDVSAEWLRESQHHPSVVLLPDHADGSGARFSEGALALAEEVIAKADVVHLHTVWDRANLQCGALATRHNVRYVITAHGMLDDWSMAQRALKKRLYHFMFLRSFFREAHAVHLTASHEKTQAERWFPKEKGVVIPLIFDLEPYRELPGSGPARAAIAALKTPGPKVLFLSRIHPKKSVEVLIDAIAKVRSMPGCSETQLLIAGTGDAAYEAQLKEQVEQLGLHEHVHFLGLVVGEEKISLFETADVFALPTSQENFGFVLVEALATQTPVVTTKGVDIWPELEASGGALIEDRSADVFARAIGALLLDSPRRERMGEVGRKWVFEYLEPSHIVKQFEAMYQIGSVGA